MIITLLGLESVFSPRLTKPVSTAVAIFVNRQILYTHMREHSAAFTVKSPGPVLVKKNKYSPVDGRTTALAAVDTCDVQIDGQTCVYA